MNRRIHTISLPVLGVVLTLSPVVGAAVRYVALDGLGTTGASWSKAYKSIQQAIDDPAIGPGDEIWVKQGTYPITSYISVDKAVKIYGGYSGSGNSRSPATYVTTIDAQELASHCFALSADCTIDGFTLTNGYALGSSPSDEGGGIYVGRCQATINNCIFERNRAGFAGGGMSCNEADGTVISNCTFTENEATYSAGALNMYNCSATVTGCTFQSNTTVGSEHSGGALVNEYGASTITNCTFVGNSASYGAAMYNYGTHAVITGCAFDQNGQAGDPDRHCLSGGAVHNHAGAPTFSRCIFTGNEVRNWGGAIYDMSTATFANCIIWGNYTWRGGGGVYVEIPEDSLTSAPHFVNCTIVGNTAFKGGGVFNYYGTPTFRNCIIWGNFVNDQGPGIWNATNLWVDDAVANYCDIQGSGVYPGQGNINADPNFAAPGVGDFRLAFDSPCVDTGDNAAPGIEFEDYEGQPRIVDGDLDAVSTVDMGAYEFQGRTAADRLYRGQIIQGLMYDGPSDQQPSHIFLLECTTADGVASIQFRSPAGHTYDIPSLPSTSNGEVQTYHEIDDTTHTWGYWGEFEDASTAADYGDGTYQLTVHYEDGSYHLTDVPVAVPGTSTPIAQPSQQPIVTEPVAGAVAGSPVTVEWLECSDTTVDVIRLAVVDRNTGQPVIDQEWDPTQERSGPHRMMESIYDVELTFANLYDIVDANATPFECGKVSVTRQQFETPYGAVYRFWSPVTSFHFYTVDEAERDWVIANYDYFWTYEGPVYNACATEYHAGLTPVYRFWSPVSGSHFYTIDEGEKDFVIANYPHVWTFEGVAFYAYPEDRRPAGTAPVYRFWKESDNTHFFTMDEAEKDRVIDEWSHVYTYEAVAFYAYP